MARTFRQVDVFTTTPYRGNPVAVVLDARRARRPRQMQRFAHWTNLSETTFLLPPEPTRAPTTGCGSSRRSPSCRSPGHPTLGTCHAWLEAGGTPARRRHDRPGVRRPGLIPIRRAATAARLRRAAAGALGAGRGRGCSSGSPSVLGIDRARRRRRAVGRQRSGLGRGAARSRRGGARGPARAASTSTSASSARTRRGRRRIEVRAFFPKDGATVEDPVTGSLNASLAGWLLRTGRADVAVRGQPGHGARPSRTRVHRPGRATARSGSAAARSPASPERSTCSPGGRWCVPAAGVALAA